MYIDKIILKNYRNYEEQEIELNPHINVFYGDNAQGKTNILESIFMSSFGKSFRTTKEKEMIKIGEDFLETNIFYKKSDREGKIKVIISNKKQIEVNGVKIKKLSELIGKLNIVIFTPDDIQILKSGPDRRRRFLDMMIGQLRPNYVYTLNLYLKTLEQRNNYLKQIREENKPDNMLEIWNEKLAEYGQIIFKYREEFIAKINNKIQKISYFFNDTDIKKIELLLDGFNGPKDILDCFSEDLFYYGDAPSKNAVIKRLYEMAYKQGLADEKLYHSIMNHENVTSTYFGNYLAIPHPEIFLSETSFISVAILPKPILWDDEYVDIVFLVSIQKNNPNAFKLWSYLSFLISNNTTLEEIKKEPTFQNLSKVISKIYEDLF